MDSSWLGRSSARPGFALVPPGSVMAASIPARSTNTPTITYLSIPSGWGVDRQGSWPVLLSGDYSMTERRPHGWALALKTHRPDVTLIHQVASPDRRSAVRLSFSDQLYIRLHLYMWHIQGKSRFFCSIPHQGIRVRMHLHCGRHLDERWNHPFVWWTWATKVLIFTVPGCSLDWSLTHQDRQICLSLI